MSLTYVMIYLAVSSVTFVALAQVQQVVSNLVNIATNDQCTPDVSQALDVVGGSIPTEFVDCVSEMSALKNKTNPDVGLTTQEIIKRYGYQVEMYNVTTDDYYILTLHRIPNPGKPAVYLQHGLGGCSDNWVMLAEKSLAFLLWNNGYDVFLGNFRGTQYSLDHKFKKWNDPKNYSYWDFSFHENGKYDVPAFIRGIKEITASKMFFIGHSMGTAAILIALNQWPEFINNNVAVIVLMGASGFAGRCNSPPFRAFSVMPADNYRQYLDESFKGRFEKPEELFRFLNTSIGDMCTPTATRCGACSYFIFAIFGFDAPKINYTNLPNAIDRYPTRTSVKTWFHYGQTIKNCNFCQYDYGEKKNIEIYKSETPPCYTLLEAKVPVYSFYGDMDFIFVPKDVERTLKLLPNGTLKENIRVDWKYWNHVDHLIAKDADELEYKILLEKLAKYL